MSGRELSRRFYLEHVRPVLGPALGDIPHAAAMLGDGSDVLGFDDDVSPDHDFGPRVQIVLAAEIDPAPVLAALHRVPTYDGRFPVYFGSSSAQNGWAEGRPAVMTAAELFTARLGFDPAAGIGLTQWLTTPTQILATVTAGAVFHDPADLLTARRAALRWYPEDVWRYALAAGWLRIDQEQPFVGRAGGRGDDLASAVIAARLVRDQMRLALLLERRWAPYSKWLGRAFSDLTIAPNLSGHFATALGSHDWRERETALGQASAALMEATNALGLAPVVDPRSTQFFDRDIRVSRAAEVVTALAGAITDQELLALIDGLGGRLDGLHRLPGTIDQAVDSVDVLTNPRLRRAAGPILGLPPVR